MSGSRAVDSYFTPNANANQPAAENESEHPQNNNTSNTAASDGNGSNGNDYADEEMDEINDIGDEDKFNFI